MRVHKGHFGRSRRALAVSVVALLAGAPVLAADAPQPVGSIAQLAAAAANPAATASGYVPTMADYLGVYDALQRYRFGVERHDEKMEESAFWERPRPQGPPPGFAPPPGANAGPPGPGGAGGGRPSWEEIKKMPGFVEVWHLPLDSYIHFESATRATHYEYFLSIYPQPEKKVEDAGSQPNASSSRTSIVGWPGHYDDVLEKRNGEWRILTRKTRINEK